MRKILLYLMLFVLTAISCTSREPFSKIRIVSEAEDVNIAATYQNSDNGGNTSMAFDNDDSFKWSGESPYKHGGWGYFDENGLEVPYIKRDRDLGQTFKIKGNAPCRLKSIIIKTGFGDNVVRQGMFGQKLSVQIFEVTGTPVLNINNSDSLKEAFHGFPHNRNELNISSERDDYFTGEKYNSIAIIRNFVFPEKADFGIQDTAGEIPPDDIRLKGRLLQFDIPAAAGIILQPGKQYAFLLMIDLQGDDRGFTLANNYSGSYPEGHAIRRDGNGKFPPVKCNTGKDFKSPENRNAWESAHFPSDFEERSKIMPSTNGYPDVDTWRDMYFIIGYE